MSKPPHSKPACQKNTDSLESPAVDSHNDSAEIQAEPASSSTNAYDQRKKALSKREIMAELSRQRFPWDD